MRGLSVLQDGRTDRDHASARFGSVGMEIYWRSFCDANGDGIGDLEGLRSKLWYLAWLGIDVVWITPFYPSPQRDCGYDVSDYRGIDPRFGTIGEFEEFLAEAKEHGIRVILDLVANHTSDQHPWFVDALSSPDSPYRGWYVFREGKPGGEPPNNWVSIFGGPAWSRVPNEENIWYLHTFYAEQPDLDWHNPAVRQEMLDIVEFWLDKGVDGFRIDYVAGLGKDSELRDNPIDPLWDGQNQRRRLTESFTAYSDDMYRYMAEFVRRAAEMFPGVLIVPEAYPLNVGVDPQAYSRFYSELHDLQHSAPFNFALMYASWGVRALKAYLDGFYASLLAGAMPIWTISNHDKQRPASRLGETQALVAMALLLTLSGQVWLYNGQEINMLDGDVSPDSEIDPYGRDKLRMPMSWTAEVNGGFTDPWVQPWLPVNDPASRNVADQVRTPGSPLRVVRDLIALRRALPVLRLGAYVPEDSGNAKVHAHGLRYEGEQITVLLNLSNRARWVRRPAGADEVTFSSVSRGGRCTRRMRLKPNEIIILR